MSMPTLSPRDLKSKHLHDASVRNAIDSALRQSHYLALRSLKVEVTDGQLLLKGRVNSYYLKQIAQTQAATAADGHLIVNEIEVA